MLDDQYGGSRFQGGKPFCASFCGSLIAGSRRAFLCVDWPCRLCLFLKWTRCERLLLVKVCKAFLFVFFLLFLLFFRHLKITLDSEQPMLKKERIIPSVWGGINVLNIFKEASIFLIIVHSSCELIFAFYRRAELKPACILLLVVTVTFFTCPDFLIYLQVAEPALSLSSVKEPYF